MSDCVDSTGYILHEQLACTSSIMDQHQAAKAEALELKCEVCGNLTSTSSEGSSRCLPCQGNLKRKEAEPGYEDHFPSVEQFYILPFVQCTKPEKLHRMVYHEGRQEYYKNLMARLPWRNKVIDTCFSSQDEVQADKATLALARQDGAAGLDLNMGGASV